MFTQTVGMTASDWPVSCVVKRSQTIEILLFFYLLLSFTEIAISGLILRLKAMELAEMRTSKPHWVEKIVQNMWELKRS